MQDICDVASWATPHIFYRLDVSGSSVAQAVLETEKKDLVLSLLLLWLHYAHAIRELSISPIVKR